MKYAPPDYRVFIDQLSADIHTGKKNDHNQEYWGIGNHNARFHKARPPNTIHARIPKSYHPYIMVLCGCLCLIIGPVTQWAVEMITQEPFL